MAKKKTIPNWVYDILAKYHNVALPNVCKEMNQEKLIADLESKVGFKVKIRVAYIYDCDRRAYLNEKVGRKPYLIAEEINR